MNIKQIAGYKAAEYVKDTMILGLGNVSTAFYMIKRVGEMVRERYSDGLHLYSSTSR